MRIFGFTLDKNEGLIFGVFTALFLLLNMLTLKWFPYTWFDEVWFIDTSVNCALNGTWSTTAQISFGGETPIALYPPLYQYLLAVWIKIWGFSLFTVRSFNIVITGIISFILFKGMRELGWLKKHYTTLLFVFLFWGTGLFAWSYRNGRPDMVNLLFSSLFVYSYMLYVRKNYSRWFILGSAILVLLSGLQACFFVISLLFYVYVIKKEYRSKTVQAFWMTTIGFIIGMIALWGHFVYHEHPKSFFWLFSQSSTISGWLQKIPFLSSYSFSQQGAGDVSPNFFSQFVDCYITNKNYFILTIVNVVAYFSLFVYKKSSMQSTGWYFLGFSLIMPIVLFFAGHFLSPYSWMFYFPAVFAALICMEEHKNNLTWAVYGILAVVFTLILGLPKSLRTTDRYAYERISGFIEKQSFEKDVVLLAPYKAYYSIRKTTRNAYYPMYPVQYMPSNVKYILIDETDAHGYENFETYMQTVRHSGSKIIAVDSISEPKIVLYKVCPSED